MHHESGAFVVSQILTEALSHNDVDVGLEAFNFMTEACGVNGCDDNGCELFASMIHPHANHSAKMWVKLLDVLSRRTSAVDVGVHIDHFWRAVDSIFSKNDGCGCCTQVIHLAQCCHGCRVLNQLLESFGNIKQMKNMIAQLLSPSSVLLDLVLHPFANYSNQTMVEQHIETQSIIECLQQNFLQCACSDFGNYVLKACLRSPECDSHRACFLEAFQKQRDVFAARHAQRCTSIGQLLRNTTTFAKARNIKKVKEVRFQ